MKRAEKEIKLIEKNNINHLFYTDKQYPNKLKLCTDSPINLYFKGNIDLNNQRFLSIVGTRKSTQFGKEYTQNLISELAKYNVVIVSGLAFGIDIAAHKAALHNGLDTVDVIKQKLQWHSSKIAKHLLQMEFKDIIIPLPGKIYKRRI